MRYPGSGHHGGVKTYSYMSAIAPMEVDEELQVLGIWEMVDPLLRCPRAPLYTRGLGPIHPQLGGKGFHKNPNGATTRIKIGWVPPIPYPS